MKKVLLTTITAFTILFAHAQQCQADFSYMQNGATIIFTDLSTINSGWSTNYSVSWNWDLGDGNSSIQQNPTHTYANPGPNNGWYWSCLIVTYYDSTTINSCTSFYCDSIFVGNSIPASWDCNPTTGCYDPGTGLGQYSSFASCDTMCGNPTPSWDCPINMPGGCYDPGTGNGQYATLAACQAVCGTPTPSWDCDPVTGCYDPGTGLGQYTTQSACQTSCGVTQNNGLCDSIIVTGSQNQLTMTLNTGLLPILADWVTSSNDGNTIGLDSMTAYHNVYNVNPLTTLPYDTITTCLTYSINSPNLTTCCVSFAWNGNNWIPNSLWFPSNLDNINYVNKKLVKVVDVLGREVSINSNQILFFIYEDGTIERRCVVK